MTTTFRVEVRADDTGEWSRNGLVFNSWHDANEHGWQLACRWSSVREYRVIEVTAGDKLPKMSDRKP